MILVSVLGAKNRTQFILIVDVFFLLIVFRGLSFFLFFWGSGVKGMSAAKCCAKVA